MPRTFRSFLWINADAANEEAGSRKRERAPTHAERRRANNATRPRSFVNSRAGPSRIRRLSKTAHAERTRPHRRPFPFRGFTPQEIRRRKKTKVDYSTMFDTTPGSCPSNPIVIEDRDQDPVLIDLVSPPPAADLAPRPGVAVWV